MDLVVVELYEHFEEGEDPEYDYPHAITVSRDDFILHSFFGSISCGIRETAETFLHGIEIGLDGYAQLDVKTVQGFEDAY